MNLSKITFFIIIPLLVIQGCKQTEKPTDPTSTNLSVNENEKWAEYLNQKSDTLASLYTEHAVKVFEDGNTLIGSKPIKDYYHKSSVSAKKINADTVILANKKRGLEYELGEYMDNNDEKYKHIIIWEVKNSDRKRVFEFVAKIKDSENHLADIDERRNLWMQLCNAHNAEALINEMYSENTIYFNHKPLVIGRDGLIQDYQYMNNEKYELTLSLIVVDQVSDNLVFEIGQCKGSYNGKYIIIWKKEESGKWEVFIDSNI